MLAFGGGGGSFVSLFGGLRSFDGQVRLAAPVIMGDKGDDRHKNGRRQSGRR
jgi:hypothetical protein